MEQTTHILATMIAVAGFEPTSIDNRLGFTFTSNQPSAIARLIEVADNDLSQALVLAALKSATASDTSLAFDDHRYTQADADDR